MKILSKILLSAITLLLLTCPALAQDKSLKSLISTTNTLSNKDHGRLYANNTAALVQGGSDLVYGVRDKGCVPRPPSLDVALSLSGFTQPIEGVAEIYDAGVGYLVGHGCGGDAPARAIGIKIAKGFAGTIQVPYFERYITVKVMPSPAEPEDSLKSMISMNGSPNIENIGEVTAGGEITLAQGQRGVIYGVRAANCATKAPSFEEALSGVKYLPKGIGKIYDAGEGFRRSASCGQNVGVRAIGIELAKDFLGKVEIPFFKDKVVLTVVPPAKVAGS
jgi:hypothetical protein